MRIARPLAVILASACALATAACGQAATPQSTASSAAAGDTAPLKVFATTGYLADAVKNLDPSADLTTMVKPGGDPHTYQPSTQDIEKMRSADVVFSTGVHMEAQMLKQLDSLGAKHLAVGNKIPTSDLLPWPDKDEQGNDLHDPHIWNSTKIWTQVVDMMAKKLGEARPAKAAEYTKNAEAYIGKIKEADEYAKKELGKIPAERRVLVTGHDAFNYFGKSYGLEIHATDFVTSEANLSAAQLSELAELIAKHKLPVIFQDNLKNHQAIDALKEAVKSRGWDVEVSDTELFADSLGEGNGVDTYLGVHKHNVDAIVKALA